MSDFKLLLLLQKEIEKFKLASGNYYSFVERLEELINGLSDKRISLREQLHKKWFDLEVIRASILNDPKLVEKPKNNFQEESNIINSSLSGISNIVSEALSSSKDFDFEVQLQDKSWVLCPKCNESIETEDLKTVLICNNCGSKLSLRL